MISAIEGNKKELSETVVIIVKGYINPEKEYEFKYEKGDTWLDLAERLFDKEVELGESSANNKDIDTIKCALFNAIDHQPIIPNIGEVESVMAPYGSAESIGKITLNEKDVMWANEIGNGPYKFDISF